MSKFFYDCEFLEGTQTKRILGIPYGKTPPTIDLISIGIVSEDNRELYLISKEFNLREAWNRYDIKSIKVIDNGGLEAHLDTIEEREYGIRENVLLPIYTQHITGDARNIFPFSYRTMKWIINQYGHTNAEIAEKVKEFCKPNREYTFEGNTVHYSEVKNPELYGYYADYDHVALCWLFGKMIDLPEGFPMYTIDLKQMLDEKAKTFLPMEHLKRLKTYPKQTNSHHALQDAKWNQELHKFIQSL